MQLQPSSQELKKSYWRYTIPAITAMLISGLYVIIDGIFIGQYVGAAGLAAINIAWTLTYVLSGLGVLIGMGAGALMSSGRGEQQTYKAKLALSTSFYLMGIFGVLGCAFLYVASDFGMQLQGATPETLQLGQDYLLPFIIGGLFTVSANALPLLMRNDDSPNFATGLLLLSAFANTVLDYVFLAHLSWGLYGAAWATIIAQGLVTIIGIGYFFSRQASLRLQVSSLRFDLSQSKQIIILGSSTLIMFLYASVMVALHNAVFMAYSDTTTLGAFALVSYLMALFYLLSQGIAEGMQPQISFYFGAKQHGAIRKVFKYATLVMFTSGLTWTAIINIFPEFFIWLFNGEQSQTTLEIASQGIQLHLFAMALDGFIAMATIYFISIEQPNKASAISIANIAIQVPFLWLLPQQFGVTGIWLAMPLSTVLIFLLTLYWVRQTFKAQQATMTDQHPPLAA